MIMMITLCMDLLILPCIIIETVVQGVSGFFILTKAAIPRLLSGSKRDRQHSDEEEVTPSGVSVGSDLPPVVLVHGVFGFGEGKVGGKPYFGGAEKKYERVFVPDLGALSSLHDRARQLFYYLKGGQVDYGAEHSEACGHSRFGTSYEQGKYPEWDEDHPVHFVGHSAGAQVLRVLHQMLADKAFEGYTNTSSGWVLSVTAICGALNGSTRTYITGMKPEEWRSIRAISLLQLCRIGVTLHDWLNIASLKNFYNLGFNHFNLSRNEVGFKGLFTSLLGKSGPFASADWIIPDLTIQGSMQMNTYLRTFPNTYYFSYAAKRTRKRRGVTLPYNVKEIRPSFLLQIIQMSLWRYPANIPPPYEGYRDEEWQDNDGEVNTISMKHPRLPREHPNCFVSEDYSEMQLQPGIWYYKIVEADHAQFVLDYDKTKVTFNQVYDSIFSCCRELNNKRVYDDSRNKMRK